MDRLETLAAIASARAVEQLPPSVRAVITPNIVEKLAHRYSGPDSGLTSFALEKISAAAPYGVFDKSESSKVGPGTSSPGQGVKETCVIAMPRSVSAGSFRATLEKSLRGQLPPTMEQVCVQDIGVPDNEVTIYQIHNLFPLRWVTHVGFLRDKYEATAKASAANAYFLHGEGSGTDYASLFIPSASTLTAGVTSHLLLAFASGMLKKCRNEKTGKNEIVYAYTDDDGFDLQLTVGANEREALTKMPSDTSLAVKRQIEIALESEILQTADSREVVFKNVVAFIKTYKDEQLGGDANHPEYVRLRASALDAKSRLLKLE